MAPPRVYKKPGPEADAFRALMVQGNFTQKELADALGIMDTTVRRYLAGTTAIPEPTIRLLRAIVRFGIDPDELL